MQASYLLFVAHYLERICDHCTNIAERVAFMETGRDEGVRHKDDGGERPVRLSVA
jgi:phosphate uptake regulator